MSSPTKRKEDDELTPDELKDLVKVGLRKRKQCALCMHKFFVPELPGAISFKSVLELRKKWNEAELNLYRIPSPSQLYQRVELCIFCMQFFDVDAADTEGVPLSATGVKDRPNETIHGIFKSPKRMDNARNSTFTTSQGRSLPRSPAQPARPTTTTMMSDPNSYNTTPAVYSFTRQTATPSMLPDTPPRPVANLSPPRIPHVHSPVNNFNTTSAPAPSTTPKTSRGYAHIHRAGSTAGVNVSPSASTTFHGAGGVMSPRVGAVATSPRGNAATATAHVALHGNTTTTSDGLGYSSHTPVDQLVSESITSRRRADAAEADFHRVESSYRDASREWQERFRAADAQIRTLQVERDNLRRAQLEQSETIAKLREHVATLGKGKSTTDKLRNENNHLKERIRDSDAKLRESDAIRAELHRRLGDQERSAHQRSSDVSGLRGEIHSKDELLSTLSETVRSRDATIGQLTSDMHVVADELGREKTDRRHDTQRLEGALVEAKERELLLRKQVGELQHELDAVKRDRDEWRTQAESSEIRNASNQQRAKDMIEELELASRAILELQLCHTTEDHCARFYSGVMPSVHEQHQKSLSKMGRLLDDTDTLVRELNYAQDVAKSTVQDRDLLGGEVTSVCTLATDIMRNIESLTSSASWRRAILETLIPDEISSTVAGIKSGIAEVVHRTNIIGKRAVRKN